MSRKGSLLFLFAILGAGLLLLQSPPAGAQTLKVGELAGLTGGIAPYGTQLHNARLLAFEEINAKGGVKVGDKRYKLELVHLDVGPPPQAPTVFERLLTVEKVNLILDGAFSAVEYALRPLLKGKKALMIWSGGNDPGTTVGVPNAFRNHFDGGPVFMKVNERFLRKMGVKRVATYGQTGHSEFKEFVEQHLPKLPGITVVAKEWFRFGEKDFFPVLTKLKGLKPDAVITHGFYTDGLNMVKQAREIGLFPGVLWVNQLAAAPNMMDSASRRFFEGTYEILFASYGATTKQPQKSKRFMNAYVKKFGQRTFGSWAESGYDSAYILAKALEKAGTVEDIPKIAAAMHTLTTDDIPELLLPYKPGKIFDAEGQAYPKILAAEWKKGRLVPVFEDYGL
ncbi:MAG: ABC transporter substrate-binding protein [Candidatus Tectomicrobia bacterium]|nr:ABC transporter substrate-binding protein [Candidatus Tectomicrobia bacterium]